MQSRTVGLRIALFAILTSALGAVVVTTGGAGGLAPSEVLAAEKIGVPIASKTMVPPARVRALFDRARPSAQVGAFFNQPVVNWMQMKARLDSSTERASSIFNRSGLDQMRNQARLASLRAVDDTIPSGYYPIEYAQTSYYVGSNTWYLDTHYLWTVINYNIDPQENPYSHQYWPDFTWVEWSWAIKDGSGNDLFWCYGVQSECIEQDWLYANNYECVGDEYFITGVVAHYFEDETWKWKYLGGYYDDNLGGCDP